MQKEEVRSQFHIHAHSRLDIKALSEGVFRAIEIRANGKQETIFLVFRMGTHDVRIVDRLGLEALSSESLQLFEALWRDFFVRMERAWQEQKEDCVLLKEGEHTALFSFFQTGVSIEECLNAEMLPIWQSSRLLLEKMGYEPIKQQRDTGEWELLARPCTAAGVLKWNAGKGQISALKERKAGERLRFCCGCEGERISTDDPVILLCAEGRHLKSEGKSAEEIRALPWIKILKRKCECTLHVPDRMFYPARSEEPVELIEPGFV